MPHPKLLPQRTAKFGLLNVAFIWSHDNRYRSKKWKSRLVFETARGFYFLTGSDLRLDFMASYCQAWNFWWNFSWIFLRQGLVISDIFRLIGLLYRSLLVSLRSFLISIGSFHLRIFFKRTFLNRHKKRNFRIRFSPIRYNFWLINGQKWQKINVLTPVTQLLLYQPRRQRMRLQDWSENPKWWLIWWEITGNFDRFCDRLIG